MSLIAGQLALVEMPTPFTDNLTGQVVDPTLVQLIVSIDGTPLHTYVFNSGDGVIVRAGVGEYHATLDTTGMPGTWKLIWSSDPDGTSPQVCTAIAETYVNVYSA